MDVVGGDLDIVESVIVKSGEGVPAVVGEADGEGVADNDPSGPVSTISTTALRLELKFFATREFLILFVLTFSNLRPLKQFV